MSTTAIPMVSRLSALMRSALPTAMVGAPIWRSTTFGLLEAAAVDISVLSRCITVSTSATKRLLPAVSFPPKRDVMMSSANRWSAEKM